MTSNVTLHYYPKSDPRRRQFALWYFGILIGVGTVVGHVWLGLEQSWAQPIVAVLTAGACQLALEWVDARAQRRRGRYRGQISDLAVFFMPAWIVGNAVAFLIYPGERLAPIAFAAAAAIGSKVLFRAPTIFGSQHVFNPSNLGITSTLLLFPLVGLAPAYHFTENVTGIWDWIVPGVVLVTGVMVHALFTGRLLLVLGWLTAFVVQALVRGLLGGGVSFAPFVPMTSAAFILFTLYMIPDPATTPIVRSHQVAFGAAVGLVYGALQLLHVVYGLFIALMLVSASRGLMLHVAHALRQRDPVAARVAAVPPRSASAAAHR
jgi:hypothetical protein